MSARTITITAYDQKRLKELLAEYARGSQAERPNLDSLAKELARAVIVRPEEIPGDVVTMHSTVSILDLDSNQREIVTLVFPEQADVRDHRISIFAPLGTGIIGYRVGDVIEWPVPAGTRRLKIESILSQPEAAWGRK